MALLFRRLSHSSTEASLCMRSSSSCTATIASAPTSNDTFPTPSAADDGFYICSPASSLLKPLLLCSFSLPRAPLQRHCVSRATLHHSPSPPSLSEEPLPQSLSAMPSAAATQPRRRPLLQPLLSHSKGHRPPTPLLRSHSSVAVPCYNPCRPTLRATARQLLFCEATAVGRLLLRSLSRRLTPSKPQLPVDSSFEASAASRLLLRSRDLCFLTKIE
ncbi:hypothetical protein GW17_00045164 [Ensete ventricosum]|nr:hypothetical protein GW17_00045164 [Ensete ventricosum]